MPRGRVAVFGDIGGHWAAFTDALTVLGMDPLSCTLPDDLTVVQVGDLVHRGPDSEKVLALASRVMHRQPKQWVQLVGNHEGIYLPDAPVFAWNRRVSPDSARLLQQWWASGKIRVATGLDTDAGPVLVTHAGLTAGLWSRLGEPWDVRDAANLLNTLSSERPQWLFQTGRMMDRAAANPYAGPLWAEAGGELYPGWIRFAGGGGAVPFGQVHGHSTAYWWDKGTWTGHPEAQPHFVPLRRARHLTGVIGGRLFAGIDPSFGTQMPGFSWRPLLFEHARVVAR